jgi:soluble lytic murein transglycosylase-like protein
MGLARRCRPAICGLCLALPLYANCQVYFGVTAPGSSVVLSNFQSQDAPDLLLAPPVEEGIVKAQSATRVEPKFASLIPAKAENLRGMIDSVASTVNVAPRLIHAVISAESNYDPIAVSPRGAIGLMQLLPATAKRFGVKDPFVAKDNVFAGASYLKWLMGFFSGDIELVLAAYNAGENAVMRAGRKVPQYPETQAYVRRIMADLRSTGALPL